MNPDYTAVSYEDLWADQEDKSDDSLSLALDLISKRLASAGIREHSCPSIFGGKPYHFGYCVGGMLMLTFTQWVIQCAIDMKLQDLYFLSRDGHIIKRVYDLIAPYYSGSPKSHYLLASRRAFNNAALNSREDVLHSLDGVFLSGSPKSILQSRFGVIWGSEQERACRDVGFTDGEALCDFEEVETRRMLCDFALSQIDNILIQARHEREALGIYLYEKFNVGKQAAVVDIGHSASLQRSLQNLVGDKSIAGFYFMTFVKARGVHTEQGPVRGWYKDFIDPTCEYLEYSRNIGMFEFLFLDESESLSHFELSGVGETAIPRYVSEPQSDRQSLVAQVHDGVLDFVRDIVAAVGGQVTGFRLDKEMATRTMFEFVARPSAIDARMLSNVCFFDGYAGEATHYMVAQSEKDPTRSLLALGDYLDRSWWKPGAWALITQTHFSRSRARLLYSLWRGPIGSAVRKFRKIRGLW